MDEIAFFLIRFVQTFEHVELAPDAQPEGTLPPAEWREGDPKVEAGRSSRKVKERIWPKVDLVMYSHVSLRIYMHASWESLLDVVLIFL